MKLSQELRRLFKINTLPKRLRDQGWEKLLNVWASLITQYSIPSNYRDPDYAFWYGERSLTGLLAAAGWQLPGGWSLEEFTGFRGRGRKRGAARGDLWLSTGKGDYTIEAKVYWPASTWEYAKPYVEEQLENAREQLKNLDKEYHLGTHISICYIVPSLSNKIYYSDKENIDGFYKETLKTYRLKNQILASYRYPDAEMPEYKDRSYPGVILVGEVVYWAGKKKVRQKMKSSVG